MSTYCDAEIFFSKVSMLTGHPSCLGSKATVLVMQTSKLPTVLQAPVWDR